MFRNAIALEIAFSHPRYDHSVPGGSGAAVAKYNFADTCVPNSILERERHIGTKKLEERETVVAYLL